MARRRHQVINKLSEAEEAEGNTAEAARRIGVTEQTFYRCRSDYGGLWIDLARRLIPSCPPTLSPCLSD